jgi:hypothetical protein
MADLLVIAAPCLMLALLYCSCRGAWLFVRWRPAAATVTRSGYSEQEENYDRWTARTFDFDGESDGDGPTRRIEEMVAFTDADGRPRRASVSRRAGPGRRPDGVLMVWYDPARPERATEFGPGRWLGLAALAAVALAALFSLGPKLADLGLAALLFTV